MNNFTEFFQVKIISQNGKIVSEFSGELKAAEFRKQMKLHGRAGDVFKIISKLQMKTRVSLIINSADILAYL